MEAYFLINERISSFLALEMGIMDPSLI